jgi:hypothetical protein
MSETLIREFLTWISQRPRNYAETMQAWSSNCPRHSVWEDALVDDLIEVVDDGEIMDQARVVLTARGQATMEAPLRRSPG